MCTCCNGRRVVPAIDGRPRPCSRCRAGDFSRWYAEPDPNLGALLREIDALLRNGEIDQLRGALAESDFANFSNDIIVGLLGASAKVCRDMPEWSEAVARAHQVLSGRGADAVRELIGL